MENKEEIETIKRKARQLKQMVGNRLALDECESFIHSTISDYKQGQTLPIDSVSKSACVGCGEDVEDYSEHNNCCNKCWLSV